MKHMIYCFTFVLYSFFLQTACKPLRNVNVTNHSVSKTMNPDSIISFRIIIKNFYFGRVNSQINLTEDSLETIHDNLNGKKTSVTRPLLSDETKKMQQFLSVFAIDDLDEKYINDKVKDGINIEFEISINSAYKRIFVSNFYQDNLGELVDVIRPMLKDDCIGYRKEYFHHN